MLQRLWILLVFVFVCMVPIHSFEGFIPNSRQLNSARFSYHNRVSKLFSTTTTPEVVATTPMTFFPEGTKYCMCGSCKTAYEVDPVMWKDNKILRVKCEVCEKEWLQTSDRMQLASNKNMLTTLSDEKIAQVRKIISESNIPKSTRIDKTELFFGNLPPNFDEDTLSKLLMEYGVTNLLVVKDEKGMSKGFGFVEVPKITFKFHPHFY